MNKEESGGGGAWGRAGVAVAVTFGRGRGGVSRPVLVHLVIQN